MRGDTPDRRGFLTRAGAAPLGLAMAPAAGAAGAVAPGGSPMSDTSEPPAVFDLAELARSVRDVVRSGRVGQPVFVRLSLVGGPAGEALLPDAAPAAALAEACLGQPFARVYATGAAAGPLSLTGECAGGATALVSLARGAAPGAGVSLMLLGSRGSVNFDEGTGPLGAARFAFGDKAAPPRLVKAIEQSLKSGRPEPVPAPEAP